MELLLACNDGSDTLLAWHGIKRNMIRVAHTSEGHKKLAPRTLVITSVDDYARQCQALCLCGSGERSSSECGGAERGGA